MKLESLVKKIEKFHYAILTIIISLAAFLRIAGANWGMPDGMLHPDELLIYTPAYNCALSHSFEVRDYCRPNHVTIKLNALLYTAIQECYFSPHGKTDFATNYQYYFSLFTTASRVLIAIFGVGIVILAYFITKHWGKNQALLAALLFAIFPSYIEHSHYITPDIPLLFFMMLVLFFALNYAKKSSIPLLFGMCLATAFATCEKYPGAYGCVIIAAVVIISHRKQPLDIVKYGLLAILFFILGIFAVSPVLIMDYRAVFAAMAGQNKDSHIGADGLNFGQTVIFYLKTTAVRLGLILTISSIYGALKSFKENKTNNLVLLVFFAYLFPISTLKIHWERYTLPIYAIALIFASLGIVYIAKNLYKSFSTKKILLSTSYVILFLLPIGSLFGTSLAVTSSFFAPDSRVLLQESFESINVNLSNTNCDSNTPLDPYGFYGVFCNFEEGDPSRPKYGDGPLYVMTSSAQRDLYLAADPNVYGWIANFYKKLDSDYPMVYICTTENPSYHFIELQNMWYAARSLRRYTRGTCKGYEIRLYMMRQVQ